MNARQMLAGLPMSGYAEGGAVEDPLSAGRRRAIANGNEAGWLQNVASVANKWLANPGTAAEAYDGLVKSGISVKDLVDAGISQDAINKALTVPTSDVQKQVNQAALTSLTRTLAQNPTLASEMGARGTEAIYAQAQQYVANLQKDGLTDAERQQLQRMATAQGWGYSDIRAAGIDPSLLFNQPAPVATTPVTPTPVTPTPVFPDPVPYTPVTVYDPEKFARENAGADLYKKGEVALDTAFRESAPRTAIPGMPGAYEYTPAAKLRPATGAGWSWTPPVVTSRPRSLLSPTLLSYVSPSQQFAQARATQDQALLGAFRESGLPQNASNFNTWRNRLRSGEFGTGAAFDPTAFQSAFGSWASTQAPGTTAQGPAPGGLGSVGTGVTGYSEIAGGLQPIDLRRLPAATFAHGGEVSSARRMLEQVKKPEGFAEGGMPTADPEQTESRSMLERLGRFISLDTPQDMSLGETVADIGMGFLPGVGTAQGARDFERARREGDTLGMALGAASMIPVAGGVVRAARKAANVAEEIPSAARQMLDQAAPARAVQTDTPEFKNWFGESAITKTLEPNGKPRRLYHITPSDFDKFNINQSDATDPLGKGSGPVIFMTDDAEEQMAAHQVGGFGDQFKEGANVMPLYASIQNPLFIDNTSKAAERTRLNLSRGWPSLYTAEDVAKLEEAGYDGVFAVNDDIPNEIVAFRQDQVKSALTNEGSFSGPVITKKDGGLVKGYNKGGEASSADMLAQQMLAIGNRPSTRSQQPAPTRTESRGMLERLMGSAQQQVRTDIVDPLVGLGEAALTLGTAIPSSVPAGLRGLYEAATTPGDLQTRLRASADIVPAQMATTTYLPRTQSGREALEQLSVLGMPAEAIGRGTLESTGSPLLAAMAETFLDPLEFLGPGAKMAGTTLPLVARAAGRADEAAAPVTESRKMLDELEEVQNNSVGESFRRMIAADTEGAINAYTQLESTRGGKLIDTDLFRELSPEYRNNRALASEVHEPASELNKLYFTRLLEKTRGQEGTWLFTGGGPASGKSSAVSSAMEEAAQGIVDGTMGNPEKVVRNINQVLEDPTKNATIFYIDRDPVKAFDLALSRSTSMENARGSGRTIPVMEFLNMHQASRQSIPKIYEQLKDNPRVDFEIWSNNAGVGEQFPTTIDKISTFNYNDALESIMNRLEEAYTNGEISEAVYRGYKSGTESRTAKGAAGTNAQIDSRINEELGKESLRQSSVNTPPTATGATLGDALSQLNITPQRREEWRSSRQGLRQEKVPQVQQAAEALREGKISTEEYQRTVQQYQPVKPLAAVQKMPTVEDIAMALGKNAEKSPGIVGVNVDIPDGTPVASRLDIPAYEDYDTWIVSLHDGTKKSGASIGYGQAALLNDVNFMSSAKSALSIATGNSSKAPIARIFGNWENRDPSAVAQQARDILSGKAPDAADWAEVGMNPFRHSYFYRKSDGMPVASAEQVIQVGPLVLAKKPVTRPVESPEHQINTPEGPRYFKKGGNVERVTNDNRKYF